MLTSADKFLELWAPKVGEEAARKRWRSNVLLLRAYLLNLVWIPLVIVGVKLPSTALLVLGILVAAAEAALVAMSSLELRAANRMTSALLGIKLGFGHVSPPPRQRRHYEEWCRQHGVAPYAANGPANRPAG